MNNCYIMNKYLSTSIMCANLLNLEKDIKDLENLNVDYFHIDIMDGAFVPNLTFGPDIVNAIRKISNTPFDIHLLMNNPRVIIRSLNISHGDIITIHSECKESIMENAAFVKQKGALFGIALNPNNTVDEIKKYLPYIDVVLLMLIVPGFAGSTMIHGMMEKVGETRKYLDKLGYKNIMISVDGSVSAERANYMSRLGANIFVGGTAGIFKKDIPLCETVPYFVRQIRN